MKTRKEIIAARKGLPESPFKAGTKRLKKGWKYVAGQPVKVGK